MPIQRDRALLESLRSRKNGSVLKMIQTLEICSAAVKNVDKSLLTEQSWPAVYPHHDGEIPHHQHRIVGENGVQLRIEKLEQHHEAVDMNSTVYQRDGEARYRGVGQNNGVQLHIEQLEQHHEATGEEESSQPPAAALITPRDLLGHQVSVKMNNCRNQFYQTHDTDTIVDKMKYNHSVVQMMAPYGDSLSHIPVKVNNCRNQFYSTSPISLNHECCSVSSQQSAVPKNETQESSTNPINAHHCNPNVVSDCDDSIYTGCSSDDDDTAISAEDDSSILEDKPLFEICIMTPHYKKSNPIRPSTMRPRDGMTMSTPNIHHSILDIANDIEAMEMREEVDDCRHGKRLNFGSASPVGKVTNRCTTSKTLSLTPIIDIANNIEAMALEVETANESHHLKNLSLGFQPQVSKEDMDQGNTEKLLSLTSRKNESSTPSLLTTCKLYDDDLPSMEIIIDREDSCASSESSSSEWTLSPQKSAHSTGDVAYGKNTLMTTTAAVSQPTSMIPCSKPDAVDHSDKTQVTILVSIVSILLFLKGINPFTAYVIFWILDILSKSYVGAKSESTTCSHVIVNH